MHTAYFPPRIPGPWDGVTLWCVWYDVLMNPVFPLELIVMTQLESGRPFGSTFMGDLTAGTLRMHPACCGVYSRITKIEMLANQTCLLQTRRTGRLLSPCPPLFHGLRDVSHISTRLLLGTGRRPCAMVFSREGGHGRKDGAMFSIV